MEKQIFETVLAETPKPEHKTRIDGKEQEKNAEIRETATTEELQEIIDGEVSETAVTSSENESENESETKEITWRNICKEYFESEKKSVLVKLAADSIERAITKFFGEKYGENFAKNLLAECKKYTHNFTYSFADTVDKVDDLCDEIKINDEKVGYFVWSGSCNSYASINANFNGFLSFAVKNKLPFVSEITKETEKEKKATKFEKLASEIDAESLAALIAKNPQLLAAILAQQSK